ncbi:MAG TPA: tRNA epoxyqueuosine(34) reductase QueG [Vicinamibacterales bacterium]|nr:tRNA epoxyqueuosine(34) reductase QueG [Vicinamibacterales bacterium]
MLTSPALRRRALELGFDLCGVSRAVRHPKLSRLADWYASGQAGDMVYLADVRGERADPRALLPTARTVVSLAVVYNSAQPYSTAAVADGAVAVSRYAWGADYHDVLRPRLRDLVMWMDAEHGPGLEALSSVDDGPVQERVFAEAAGLGWIGKNTCLINPRLGSWVFLAAIVTNADLEPDTPGVDQCGTCTRCLDACPTGAFVEPYRLDATRCLSYLTIEARGQIDPAMQGAVRDRVFGCDICQDVCPWNARAATSDDPDWQPRRALLYPKLVDLCRLSDEGWRLLLRQSALRRAGLARLRRNLACAAAHLPATDRAAALDALESQPSATDPRVAAAIVAARAGP